VSLNFRFVSINSTLTGLGLLLVGARCVFII
jgi:hypothetical protein